MEIIENNIPFEDAEEDNHFDDPNLILPEGLTLEEVRQEHERQLAEARGTFLAHEELRQNTLMTAIQSHARPPPALPIPAPHPLQQPGNTIPAPHPQRRRSGISLSTSSQSGTGSSPQQNQQHIMNFTIPFSNDGALANGISYNPNTFGNRAPINTTTRMNGSLPTPTTSLSSSFGTPTTNIAPLSLSPATSNEHLFTMDPYLFGAPIPAAVPVTRPTTTGPMYNLPNSTLDMSRVPGLVPMNGGYVAPAQLHTQNTLQNQGYFPLHPFNNAMMMQPSFDVVDETTAEEQRLAKLSALADSWLVFPEEDEHDDNETIDNTNTNSGATISYETSDSEEANSGATISTETKESEGANSGATISTEDEDSDEADSEQPMRKRRKVQAEEEDDDEEEDKEEGEEGEEDEDADGEDEYQWDEDHDDSGDEDYKEHKVDKETYILPSDAEVF